MALPAERRAEEAPGVGGCRVPAGQGGLPIGFRFRPTDEELLLHYLRRKALSCPLPADIIPVADLARLHPWDLPGTLHLLAISLTNGAAAALLAHCADCLPCACRRSRRRALLLPPTPPPRASTPPRTGWSAACSRRPRQRATAQRGGVGGTPTPT
uniref:NAC domain-containing protein n=1 Tax=Aegilops tauschii subsp. strangulata TaxID=200361 RepID=A0A453GDM7_AEGTS